MKIHYTYTYETDPLDLKQTKINKNLSNNKASLEAYFSAIFGGMGILFLIALIADTPILIIPIGIAIYYWYKHVTDPKVCEQKAKKKRLDCRFDGLYERLKMDKVPDREVLEKKKIKTQLTDKESDELEIGEMLHELHEMYNRGESNDKLYYELKLKINIYENKYLGENNPIGLMVLKYKENYAEDPKPVSQEKEITSQFNKEKILTINTSKNIKKNDLLKCPNCGKEVIKEAKYCTNCGSDLKAIKIKYCKKCGNKIEENEIFCRKCGYKVGK